MFVEKNTIIKIFHLTWITLMAAVGIYISDSLMIHVFLVLIVCTCAILEVNFDLLHPYTWFSGFMGLYSVAYPLICVMGFPSKVGYSKDTMLYQLLYIYVSLLVITPAFNKDKNNTEKGRMNVDIGVFNRLIYFLMSFLIIVGSIIVYKRGFSGKDDIYMSGDLILLMIFRLPLILTLLYTILVLSIYSKTKKFPFKQMIITAGVLLFITLFSGERDFIFRFLIANIMILWALNILRLKHIFVIAPAFIIILPLSSSYKYFFLTGISTNTNSNLIYSFLSGEFESATRNLQMLINHSDYTKGIKGISLLFDDIVSTFCSNISSPTAWFNETFYPMSKTQYGFTLVGEGYIIGGVLGVIILAMIVGIIVKLFYKNAYKSIYFFAAYIYFITVTVYSIRGDFGTICSALIKQILLVILILKILEKLGKKQI